MDKVLMKYSDISSPNYMNFFGAYRFNSIMNKDKYYGNGAEYDFCGLRLFGPKNYDEYLKKIYGDYMQLPPVEERNKHSIELI